MPKQLGTLILVAGVALTTACGGPAATGGPLSFLVPQTRV
jgi:hypothetical protein